MSQQWTRKAEASILTRKQSERFSRVSGRPPCWTVFVLMLTSLWNASPSLSLHSKPLGMWNITCGLIHVFLVFTIFMVSGYSRTGAILRSCLCQYLFSPWGWVAAHILAAGHTHSLNKYFLGVSQKYMVLDLTNLSFCRTWCSHMLLQSSPGPVYISGKWRG